MRRTLSRHVQGGGGTSQVSFIFVMDRDLFLFCDKFVIPFPIPHEPFPLNVALLNRPIAHILVLSSSEQVEDVG